MGLGGFHGPLKSDLDWEKPQGLQAIQKKNREALKSVRGFLGPPSRNPKRQRLTGQFSGETMKDRGIGASLFIVAVSSMLVDRNPPLEIQWPPYEHRDRSPADHASPSQTEPTLAMGQQRGHQFSDAARRRESRRVVARGGIGRSREPARRRSPRSGPALLERDDFARIVLQYGTTAGAERLRRELLSHLASQEECPTEELGITIRINCC